MSGFGKKPGGEQTGGTAASLPVKSGEKQSAALVPLRPRRKCPICGKKAAQAAYPFCSIRCANIDLDRWLSGRYRIAGSADDDDAPAIPDSPAGSAPDDALDID
jgi:endogenous inhibitor of DNA gyrase (YacG/DUF329 family)